jgi:hypothetical protein
MLIPKCRMALILFLFWNCPLLPFLVISDLADASVVSQKQLDNRLPRRQIQMNR